MKINFLLIFISANFFAQTSFKFSGKVISDKNNEPIAFVNIRLLNEPIGTVTNSEGYFEINKKDSISNLKILLSHINYNDTIITIENNYHQLNKIYKLKERYVELGEVGVYANSAYEQIIESNNKLKINSPEKELYLKAFYKEIIIKDNIASRYSEAFFNIYLPTLYKKINSEVDKNRKIELLANRTFFNIKDTLVDVRQSPYKILNNVFINVIPIDSSIYEYKYVNNYKDFFTIDIIPKPNKAITYSYECIINKETLSFTKIKIYISDFTFNKFIKDFTIKNPKGTISVYSKLYNEIFFISLNNITYVASVHNYVKEKFINNSINYSANIERNSYLLITEQYRSKIKLKNILHPDDYLHKVKPNNDAFWDSQNKVVESMNDSILRKQLEN